MNRPPLVLAASAGAAAAAVVIVAVVACQPASPAAPGAAAPPPAAEAPTSPRDGTPSAAATAAPIGAAVPLDTAAVRGASVDHTRSGTVESLALGYMQALQRADWADATGYLSLVSRRDLQMYGGSERRATVGEDVWRNAGGGNLGPCTTAQRLRRTVVVVTCGTARVAVPVEPLKPWRGVKPSLRHAAATHVPGPHTHAFSGLLTR